jgi:selenide,water dikinase
VKKIILLGAGHANLEVLKALNTEETAENKFVLISPTQSIQYSGMIPRLIMGEIQPSQLSVAVKDFAEKKGVEFVQGRASQIDLTMKQVKLEDGQKLNFDVLSINIGGSPGKIETQCPHNTVYLKPFTEFFEKWHSIQGLCSSCRKIAFVIVGGGAAAVEIAIALKLRLMRNNAKSSTVHLVTRGNRICQSYKEPISAELLKSILALGIKVHFNEDIESIPDKYLTLKNGEKIKFDYIFVSTPNQPAILDIQPKPKQDSSGFYLSDKKLQLAPLVFIAGDCANINGISNLPKSGVIAVHEGRMLVKNIRSGLSEGELLEFDASSKTLNILVDGESSARLIWGDATFSGKIAMKIKNWIDNKYMKKFR